MTFEYTPGQKSAIDAGVSGKARVMVINGGPGTGKTTIIREVCRQLTDKRISFAMATPSGRAAKRIIEATGFYCSTIHSLLGAKKGRGGGFIFTADENNPLIYDCLILDESGMIQIHLMKAIMKAIDPTRTRIIMVGDYDQLAPVGVGFPFRDIIHSAVIPVYTLDRAHRFLAASRIADACDRIKNGQKFEVSPGKIDPDAGENLRHIESIPNNFIGNCISILKWAASNNHDPIWDIQILSTTNKRGQASVANINTQISNAIFPGRGDARYVPGDKVIYLKNEQVSGTSVVNGDIGKILEVVDKKVVVQFFNPDRVVTTKQSNKQLMLAYGATVWKYQGSEVPFVIFPVMKENAFQMNRNLLYTGISRAIKGCFIVGSLTTAYVAINKTQADRVTGLRQKLKEIFAAF